VAKVVVLCVGMSAALAAWLTFAGYTSAAMGLDRQADATLNSDALLVVQTIDAWHRGRLDELQVLAGLPVMRRVLEAGGDATGQDVASANDALASLNTVAKGDVTGVALMDASGSFVLSSSPAEVGTSLAQRDYFREAMQGHLFVSGVTISLITGGTALFHSVPVVGASGHPIGVLRSRSSLAAVQQPVEAAVGRAGTGATGVLLDQNGLVIASGAGPTWLLRPVVPLAADVRDALVRGAQWGKADPPAPLGEADLGPIVGTREWAAFAWRSGGTDLHAVALPLQTVGWAYVDALPVATFEAAPHDFLRAAALSAALALAVASLLSLILARSLAVPLTRVTRAARALADGDLTETLTVRSGDEVGQLSDAFRDMAARLRGVTGEIQQGARQIGNASSQILGAMAQQSSGAVEQSAAIAETTATVEQVKASAEQAVQLALVVADTAQEALRVAGDGVQAAQHATAGMAELHTRVQAIADNILALSDQGQQIGDIVATVNDLADQSNLLALNAAIEASRAGEHGRGFAVVAGEIRSLAEQSKAHTAQVRTLLGDIQRATNAAVLATEQGTRGVVTGTRLVEQTEQTIAELTVVIEQAAGSAQRIAGSVRQHSVGMDQIAGAMGRIYDASAQSVAVTAHTRQEAEALTELAVHLNQLTNQYTV